MKMRFVTGVAIITMLMAVHPADAQNPLPLLQPPGAAGPPIVITLQDALDRAKKLDAQFLASTFDAQLALEDRIQAKAATLPAIGSTTQMLLTQGNGQLPSGRYVTNDGVHVYRQWGVLRQELSPNTVLQTGYRRAQAAEAIAKAKVDVAENGLTATVTRNYYALVTAQRKYVTAQQLVQQAQRFL